MTPEQIKILTSLAALSKSIGGWPFGLMAFSMVIGPWVLAMFMSITQSKRLETVIKMYESNVRLVEKYECLASDLKEVIILNTQTMTHLVDRLDGKT